MQSSTQLILPDPTQKGVSAQTHYSNFFLTINTNYRPPTKVQAVVYSKILYELMPRFFTKPVLAKCIRAQPGTKISSVQVVDWGVELGTHPQGQRLHTHAFIKFVHNGSMQLDIPSIQRELLALWPSEFESDQFRAFPAPKSIAVHVKWIPAREEMLARYIHKQKM